MPDTEKTAMQTDMKEPAETPAERVERIKKKAMEGLEAPTPDSADKPASNKAAYVSWLKNKMVSSVGNGVSQDVMGKYMGKLRKKVKGK